MIAFAFFTWVSFTHRRKLGTKWSMPVNHLMSIVILAQNPVCSFKRITFSGTLISYKTHLYKYFFLSLIFLIVCISNSYVSMADTSLKLLCVSLKFFVCTSEAPCNPSYWSHNRNKVYLLIVKVVKKLFIYLFEGIHYSMIYQRNELLKLLSVKVLGS